MLLRRIKHHVANENWFAVCVDFVIVVVGVYVGIEVSNWNEARQEEERAQEYLERIRDDLELDRTNIANRQEFWSAIIGYGNVAIEHAESGSLHEGSVGQTVLAYFQASQVDPYAPVSTTYDELKAAGDLRLIKDSELRARLADYYVNSTSLQAEYLFELVPEYRESVRGIMPHSIQQFVWAECHATEGTRQKLLDCDLPVENEDGLALLSVLRSDAEVVRGLRFWINNLSVSRLALDDNKLAIEDLLQFVDRALAAN